MRRLTIADIAREAGVSTGAVSYALNDKPGVAPGTRERILRVAAELGWRPSSAARALTGGGAGAIGLVVDRPARVLGSEPFFTHFLSGVQVALQAHSGTSLMLQMSDDQEAELDTYRSWWAQRKVDGVLLVDLRVADPRAGLVRGAGLPAVAVGPPQEAWGVPSVWTDDAAGVAQALEHLHGLGHRDVARVSGPEHLLHTRVRDEAFSRVMEHRGLRPGILHTDYTGDQGASATRRLLARTPRPTAILYDNDVMAVAAMGVARELGLDVPGDLSVIAWDDSPLCGIVRPVLTAVRRDIEEHGRMAAESLLLAVAGEEVPDRRTGDPELIVRGTTAEPRGTG
ncbi:DNA-binding transcriptional regulator, LacI/PurR family [Nocardiopsis flavescens]|uniref:DNA-binding transcriptional regulator, LacI/PurR family n=1 Tax=Nocardiopsis flavescens TaxID=758803 RepID=A0A1M6LYS4_9ACTN|nr:LacI family DNA-binding transcriptional regulator [Nocardiopsis flavescens]SHJ76344.1 DNA-binding transcriptional regulator, LacI/PurR family [Nocardiopsis flavescens]